MGVSAFVRYSIESVLRNRRRSLYAITGIAIAVSLVSGSLIAVDSSARSTYNEAISEVAVDFYGRSDAWSYPVDPSVPLAAMADLKTVSHVEEVANIVSLHGWTFLNANGDALHWEQNSYGYGAILLLGGDCDRLIAANGIVGAMPEPGTVAISQYASSELGIGVGSSIICSQEFTREELVNGTYLPTTVYVNLTLSVSQIWSQGNGPLVLDAYFDSYLDPVVLNLEDAPLVNVDQVEYSSGGGCCIWIDRSEVLRLGDPGGTINRLESLCKRLQVKAAPYQIAIYTSDLENTIRQVKNELDDRKMMFIGLSLPVLALGAYLSLVGIDLGMTERRREIGVLKSRGASDRQVLWMMLVESSVLGAISGILGLLFGALLSRLLLGSAASTYASPGGGGILDFGITPFTLIVVVAFGVSLMFASSFRPMRKALRIDVAESLHYYVPKETTIGYRPHLDIIALLLVGLSVTAVAFASKGSYQFGSSFVVGSLTDLILQIGIVILPAIPLLLSISVIRLLTRGTRRPYKQLARITRPWTKELSYIVDRNIVRNPRRASNLCIIISLAIAFSLFISITAESTIAYQKRTVTTEVGADMHIRGSATRGNESGWMIDPRMLNTIESLDGVKDAVIYYETLISGVSYILTYGAVVDVVKYAEVIDPDDFWFVGSDSSALLNLQTNGTVILYEWLADEKGLVVGDVLTVYLSEYGGPTGFPLEVVGIVKNLPGLDHGLGYIVDKDTFSFAPLRVIGRNAGALVNFEKGANHTVVASEVTAVFQSAGYASESRFLSDELETLEKDPKFRSAVDFLYMEYALAFIIMSAGIGLVVFVTVSEREHELACIMARGASSRQMRRILMGEAIALLVMGVGVGVSTGMFTAVLFNYLSSVQAETLAPHPLEITYVTWAIIGFSTAAFLLASLLATHRAGKMRLAEVLRIRGG